MPTIKTVGYTPAAASSTPATATTQPTGNAGGAVTSGPLTPNLASFRFKSTGKVAPKTASVAAKKGKPNAPTAMIPTATTRRTVPVTTRTAALRYIANLKTAPQEAPSQGEAQAAAKGLRAPTAPGALTGDLAAVVTTIGDHLFGTKFNIAKVTPQQWTQIRSSAETRVHERAAGKAATQAQAAAAATQRTTSISGQALYTDFVKAYNSGDTGNTPNTKKLTTKQIWNRTFVDMGLTSTFTPSPAEAQKAYKQVLTMAQSGNVSATTIISTQIKAHATTLQTAETGTAGVGQGGQALADYYVQQFTQIAHTYLVPLSPATINQRAALAAAAGTGTYRTKEAETSSFTETMQKQASSLYSSFATQINKGVTTRTLLNPYTEVAAKTLGYGTGAGTSMETAISNLGITWLQPKWNVALSGGKAATGKLSAPMSLTAFRQHLITTPQYGWTKTATGQQVKLNVGQQLAQAFGLRKA